MSVATIEKLVKEGVVVKASEMRPLERVPTGSLSLDYVLNGGWVKGAIHLIVGMEGVGKSTLAMTAIRQIQQQDENAQALVLDLERSWFVERLRDWNIDLNRVDIARPSSLETAYDLAFCGVERYEIIVIDSISAIASEAEARASVAEKQYAPGAREANAFLRRLLSSLNGAKHNPLIIILSQVRDVLGFAGKYSPVGGHGVKHYCHVWLDLHLRGYVTVEAGENKIKVGQLISFRCEKSKVGAPFRVAESILIFSPYKHLKPPTFDPYFEVMVWGERLGVITHRGAWYYCNLDGKEIRWQGREGIYAQPIEVIKELWEYLRPRVLAFSIKG